MSKKYNKSFLFPVVIGLVLICVGFFLKTPGGALTTYGNMDGYSAYSYNFDDRYSSIDEYVGGDAYNYIIGACLVGGKIAGTMATKAIFVVGGALSFGLGLAFMYKTSNSNASLNNTADGKNVIVSNGQNSKVAINSTTTTEDDKLPEL